MIKRIVLLTLLVSSVIISCKKEANVNQNMEETFYVRNGNTDMPAFVYGNGASNVFILVLHGGPGGNGLEYRAGSYAKKLEEKYAMVYWDQRHQGNSHGHLKEDDITIDAMVEDTHVLIKTLKKRYGNSISVFLLGHSWGGTLGSAYMVKNDYQHELAGWIEVDGAHDIPLLNIEVVKMIKTIGAEEVAAGRNVAEWEPMITYANSLDTANITFEQTGELNGYGHKIENLLAEITTPAPMDQGLMDYFFTSPGNPIQSSFAGVFLPESFQKSVEKATYTDELSKITIPTLLQWGKYDFVVPPALGYSAFSKIGSANKYLKIYEHSAHSPMSNEPELFVNDIIEFIELYK